MGNSLSKHGKIGQICTWAWDEHDEDQDSDWNDFAEPVVLLSSMYNYKDIVTIETNSDLDFDNNSE